MPDTIKSPLETAEKYKILIQNLPQIVYMLDAEQRYVCGSKSAELFLFRGAQDFQHSAWFQMLSESSAEQNDYVLKTQKTVVCERTFFDDVGKEYNYKISKLPVLGANDKVEGIVTTVEDLCGKKELETRQNMFISTLAHDLKNLLQAQLHSLKLLHKGSFGEINSEQKEMLEMTIESADFMKNLLYSVTKTYKDNHGAIIPKFTEFDIKELVEICIKEIKTMGQERKVCINFEAQNDELKICADKSLVRRVIENILNNVVNHAFNNTTVKVVLKRNKDKVIFSFENQSREISDELKEKIFEKYISSKRNGFNVGLGLYFCKKAVTAHGGVIYLKNNGQSNKFVVELPLQLSENIKPQEIHL